MVSEKTGGRNPELIAEMEEKYLEEGKRIFLYGNSKALISGVLANDLKYSHTVKETGKKFYSSSVIVSRKSGTVDYIPIIVSEDKLPKEKNKIKQYTNVKVGGALKTCKVYDKDVKECFIQANVFEVNDEEKHENIVYLRGFILIRPRFIETKSGKRILYVVLEVPFGNGRKSYISCMIWNYEAERAKKELNEGDKIEIYGSIQSRIHREEDPNNPGQDIEIEKYEVPVIKYNVLRKKS